MSKSEAQGKYRRIDVNDRAYIQQALNQGMAVNKIAEQLDKSPSSIKREIERNCEIEPSSGNDCLNKKGCKERNACIRACNKKLCRTCSKCYKDDQCRNYIKAYCETLMSKSPHVCNGCKSRYTCPFEKLIYKGGIAHKKALQNQQDKVRPFFSSEEEIKLIDELISPLIKNGMSPEAALSTVRDRINISLSTLYRMIDACVLEVRNGDLPEKVGRRRRNPGKPKEKPSHSVLTIDKKNRTYRDYREYIAEHDVFTVQMDCVEGRKTETEAILSLHWVIFHMQLYFMLPAHDAANVVKMLDIIEKHIGLNLFRECIPLILTDNGEEFTDIEGMERSCTVPGEQRTMIFFCEPNRSDQKGSCEVNHRLLRRIIPKRTSYEDKRNMPIHGFRQYHMTIISNHINSYPRPDMNYMPPYAVAMPVLPKEFFDNLGLELIPCTDVILKPSLVYTKNNPSGNF